MTELKGRHILFLLFACRFAYTFFFLLLLLFLISSAYFFELGKVIFLLRGRLRADYKRGARAIGRVKLGVSHSSSVQSKVQRFFFK